MPSFIPDKRNLWLPAVLLSVVITFFSFPPFPLGWLMLVGAAPVFFALDRAPSAKAAFGRMFCFVFICNVLICWWVAHAIGEFARMPWFVSYPAVLALSAYEQLAWPVVAWVRHRLREARKGALPLLWTPAAIVILDSLWPKVFPNSGGYVFYRLTWLAQTADVAGIAGLTFILVATNECAGAWLSGAGTVKERKRSTAMVAGLVVAAFAYGGWRHHQVTKIMAAPARTLKVALVQPNVNSLMKVKAEIDKENARRGVLELLFGMTDDAVREKPDLIFWPETAFPGGYVIRESGGDLWQESMHQILREYSPQPTAGISRALDEFVLSRGVPLLFGTPATFRNQRYNAIVQLLPGDSDVRTEYYFKSILLELGEYLPLVNHSPALTAWTRKHGGSTYAHGKGPVVLEHPRAKLGPMICLEGLYPRYVRKIAKAGAEILVNATNDSWFGPGMEPVLHLHLTAFRSIETRRPLVRATNTGHSAVVDIDGSLRLKTPLDTKAVVIDEVPVYEGVGSPYLFWGDLPLYLFGLWALWPLGMSVLGRPRSVKA